MPKTFILPATITERRFIVGHDWTGSTEQERSSFLLGYQAAQSQHWFETRNGGETRYIEHPMIVADALYRLGFDTNSQITGLLHDVQENGEMTNEEIRRIWGNEVADMVAIHTKDKENPDEFFKQLLEGTKLYFQVAFTRLLDRWHNLITLFGFSDAARRLRYLKETLNEFREYLRECRRYIPEALRATFDAIRKTVLCLAKGMLAGME